MTTKRLFLIRHGETNYNIEGIVQGRQIDSELNSEGLKQRDLVCKRFEQEAIDHIYITNLKRTFQTMEPLINKGFEYSREANLDELNFGAVEGKPIFDEHGNSILTEVLTAWQKGALNVSFPEGESPLEALERVKLGFDSIMSKTNEKQVIICLHQRILRIVMCYLFDKPLTDMDKYPHHNTGVTSIEYNSDIHRYKLIEQDNVDHLNSFLY
jgi:broad specificity phosphatase PhoE